MADAQQLTYPTLGEALELMPEGRHGYASADMALRWGVGAELQHKGVRNTRGSIRLGCISDLCKEIRGQRMEPPLPSELARKVLEYSDFLRQHNQAEDAEMAQIGNALLSAVVQAGQMPNPEVTEG